MFQKVLKQELTRQAKRALEKGDDSSDDSEKQEEYFKAPKTMSLKKQRDLCVSNALKVVEFHFLTKSGEILFVPTFAHQFFGDDEKIVGYKDLQLKFYYSASSLKMYIDCKYTEKLAEASPPDLLACLREWMPEVEPEQNWRSSNLAELQESVKAVEWSPPGKKVTSYESHNGDEFQVWHGKFSDDHMRAYHQRMRPFMIWFVDGARYLDDTDDKWDVFMLFHVVKDEYILCGYVTCYPFFSWDGGREVTHLERMASRGITQQISKNVEDVVTSIVTKGYDSFSEASKRWYQSRFRVSQFLILPPFQRQGHGKRLLNVIYDFAIECYSPIRDFTVEDPSPSFVKLRDYCDLSLVQEKKLLEKDSGNDLDAIAQALRERYVCQHQINRIQEIVKYLEASRKGEEELKVVVQELKKRIFKENSADIPLDDEEATKEAVEQLWEEEQKSFDGTLAKLKLE